jgi:tetratricopeptide (TPR) repeat protein
MRELPSRFAPWVSAVVLWLLATVASAQPPGRVSGIVRDEDEQPIKAATVTAQNSSIGVSYTASTDEKGRFVLLGLRPGEWVFYANAPGHAGAGSRLNVRAASNLNPPLLFALRRNGPGAGGALEKLTGRDIQNQLEQAEKQFTDKKYDEAIATYRSLIANAEPLSFLNLQVAAAYLAKNDLTRAQAAYDDVLKADPGNEKALLGVAELKKMQGDTAGAVLYLERAAGADNPAPGVLLALGELQAAAGKLDDAVQWFTKATTASPYWGRPLYRLGEIAASRGDRPAAERYMERVLAVDPTSAEASHAKQALGKSGT